MRNLIAPLLFLLFSLDASAYCFNKVAKKYDVDIDLLYAIVEGESSFNHLAMGVNKDKVTGKVTSEDIGLFQVNSYHLARLGKRGITRADLYMDPCLNADVGTSILVDSCGNSEISWDCIGAYNAGPGKGREGLRLKYANKVYPVYVRLKKDRQYKAAIKSKIPKEYAGS